MKFPIKRDPETGEPYLFDPDWQPGWRTTALGCAAVGLAGATGNFGLVLAALGTGEVLAKWGPWNRFAFPTKEIPTADAELPEAFDDSLCEL